MAKEIEVGDIVLYRESLRVGILVVEKKLDTDLWKVYGFKPNGNDESGSLFSRNLLDLETAKRFGKIPPEIEELYIKRKKAIEAMSNKFKSANEISQWVKDVK